MNRKERYYAATALPALVTANDINHLPAFLELCGLTDCSVDGNLQFFTEYGFAESLHAGRDLETWGEDWGRDTPDLVIHGANWLLVIEAKFFHCPSSQQLREQLLAQTPLVDAWRKKLDIPEDRLRHVLLIPQQLAAKIAPSQQSLDQRWPIVTWQHVLRTYSAMKSNFWYRVLSDALDAYPQLASEPSTSGANADGRQPGHQIVTTFGFSPMRTMGRKQGLAGAALADDIRSGAWKLRQYEVSRKARPANPNWFKISDFVSRLPKGSEPELPLGIGWPMEDRPVRALLLWRRELAGADHDQERWQLKAFVYYPLGGDAVVDPSTDPDWDYLAFGDPQAIWDRLWGQFEYAMPGSQVLIYEFFTADSVEIAVDHARLRMEDPG